MARKAREEGLLRVLRLLESRRASPTYAEVRVLEDKPGGMMEPVSCSTS